MYGGRREGDIIPVRTNALLASSTQEGKPPILEEAPAMPSTAEEKARRRARETMQAGTPVKLVCASSSALSAAEVMGLLDGALLSPSDKEHTTSPAAA